MYSSTLCIHRHELRDGRRTLTTNHTLLHSQLEADGYVIAQYHEKRRGLGGLFSSGPNDSKFTVATPALDMLDLIVLTWAIVERRRQIRKEAAKNAAGG